MLITIKNKAQAEPVTVQMNSGWCSSGLFGPGGGGGGLGELFCGTETVIEEVVSGMSANARSNVLCASSAIQLAEGSVLVPTEMREQSKRAGSTPKMVMFCNLQWSRKHQ